MADSDEVLRTTIDDYLLSLADGLLHAQGRLDRAIIGGEGRERFTYTIPRIDFELRLLLEAISETRAIAPDRGALSSPYAPVILLRPVAATESTARARAELASTIRGSFVAVPVGESRSPIVLRAAVGPQTAAGRPVSIRVTRPTGEAVPGLPVEVNLDKDRSAALTRAAGIAWTGLMAGTFLQDGLLVTGEDGTAKTVLAVDTAEPKGAVLLVTFDARGTSESVAVRVD